jgi:hypothetical protein
MRAPHGDPDRCRAPQLLHQLQHTRAVLEPPPRSGSRRTDVRKQGLDTRKHLPGLPSQSRRSSHLCRPRSMLPGCRPATRQPFRCPGAGRGPAVLMRPFGIQVLGSLPCCLPTCSTLRRPVRRNKPTFGHAPPMGRIVIPQSAAQRNGWKAMTSKLANRIL